MASTRKTPGRRPTASNPAGGFVPTAQLESLPVMLMAFDRNGRVVAWNDECRRVTGLALADLLRDGWRALFPEAGPRRRWQAEFSRRRRGPFRDWEWEVSSRSGERRVLSWSSVDGPTTGDGRAVWAAGRDVTAERRLREALRTLEQNLHVAQSVVEFGLWDFDPATGRVQWSPELERIYGLEPGAFGGKYQDFLALLHPDDRAGFERRNREMTAADLPVFEQQFRVVRPDGSVRWIQSRSLRFREADGSGRRVVGINVDVTDRQRAAETLREKDDYLEAALKSSKFVIWRQDRNLRYTWIRNPGLGLSPGDLIGRNDDEAFEAESARPLTTLKRRVLRSGRGGRQEVWVTRGGRRGCYDLIVEPQRDARGRITGIVCAASDVTERAVAQAELEQTKQQLQRLAARLQDTIEEERRSIAQDVHDQVGAMLTGMRMRLANLASRLPAGQRDTREAVQAIAAVAERALAATRDICARIQPPSLEDLGLAETCRWYLRDWSRSTGLRATGRFPRLDPEPAPEVSIDLFRTLQELLTNVARHSGGTRVRASLDRTRSAIRLRVSDDGHGFDPDSARCGLGFTGLRERAARHGGHLEIRSGPRGSTVTVTMPRKAGA